MTQQPDGVIDRARELRRQSPLAERILWSRLRGGRCGGVKFRRQHPIGPFFADFCCTTAKLVIELDGQSHDEQVDYDRERSQHLEAAGYRVLRFKNREVLDNIDGVASAIEAAVSSNRNGGPSGDAS